MSQENTQNQVQRIREIANMRIYAESVAQILSETMRTAPMQVRASVQKFQITASASILLPDVNILKSPTSLKTVLQTHYKRNLAVLNSNNTMKTDRVSKIKTAAIMTMQQENLKIENKPLVMQSIQELMAATTLEQTTEKLSSALAAIKNEHTKVFTKTLSSVIQIASTKVGFTQVKSEIVSPNLTRIVATNPKGYNLISEIHTDKKKKIDVLSELEGITDGSCKKIMDDFNRELETLEIVAERKERKPTGGIAQMPYAQKLQKQRNSTKRKSVNEQVITKDNKNQTIQYIND
jgi:hypothetical protein